MTHVTDRTRQILQLADGRALTYAEYGDPDGAPIVNCHGGLLCRLDVEPAAGALGALGARVVSPDRPGVGGSDCRPGRVTVDFVADVEELLDALGIGRCAVMGWSFGGQYAAALAARLGDRVDRAAIIAGCLPLDDERNFRELNRMDRRFTWLSRHARPVARATFAALRTTARRFPERVASSQARKSPSPDADVLRAQGDWFGRAMAEGMRSTAGVVDEYLAATSPWGFDLADITVPLHVYQGTSDPLVPPAWAGRIAAAVDSATVHSYEGEGHMIAVARRSDVARDLLGQPRPRRIVPGVNEADPIA